jgi:TRAP-type C4-dicarboxylate transport system substrate-binding protein
MSQTTKIRWVIAHEPLTLFVRAAKDFQDHLNTVLTADKQVEVEIMTLTEYSQKYNKGVIVTKHDLLDLMEQGKIEMSQMYTTWLAEHYEQDFLALDLPFLFTDHDHATRVLEGEIGETLLSKLTDKSNVRGLSFTYSGGFRQMISNKQVSTLADLVGTKQRSNRNPVAVATYKALGLDGVACELEDIRENMIAGTFEGAETNYPRIYPFGQNDVTKTVLDTEHSLFLTTMIIGDRLWESLDADVQAVIKTAAIEAGREERAETIRDGEIAKQKLLQEGATIKPLSAKEKAWAIEKTAVVYDQFRDTFTAGLVDKIKKS